MEAELLDFGIDRTKYHGDDLEGPSIIRLCQNADKIFNISSIEINKIITNEKEKNEVNEYTERYIEIYTLFYSLFSLSRILCGYVSKKLINKLEVVIKSTLSCLKKLRLSTKMIKKHGI